MNMKLDLRLLGGLLILVGIFQLLPVGVAVVFGETAGPYVAAACFTLLAGMILAFSMQPEDNQIRPRDGFFIVGCSWLLCSIFGALPYVLAGSLGPIDAFFEAASGFTTTGSTVLTHIEAAPRALLFWRAFTQWLGGMGIIVFSIAILPLLGIGGMQLFRAEISGPMSDKLRPRVAATARRLWYIYVGLTSLETLSLRLAGLNWYEAVCHAFTTMATGGFSTRDASIGAYHSPSVEWIVIIFMLLGGMNFVLHYRTLLGQGRQVMKDAELHYYLGMAAMSTIIIILALAIAGVETKGAVREPLFQTVSILTTTGFGTADYERWPPLAQYILLLLMLVGGMAGSTSGGIKSLRMLIGFRAFLANVDRLIHPHAVRPVKYGGKSVPEPVLDGIWAFLAGYLVVAAIASGIVTASGYDIITAISATFTVMANIGPGLGAVGPMDNFAHFPAHVKIVLSFCMIAGRLEIFTLVLLFLPAFWRR